MPHEKVREENKKRVIEEAARLFKENGLEKTTIEMIANAAGLTKRSVQNYYETKNAIILDVFRLHEKKQKDIADKYIKSEHFQSLSGLEQVRDLIGIGLRDVIIHADEVMHLFRLRQYIFEEKMLSYGEMEVGSSLLEENIRAGIRKGYEDGSIRPDAFKDTTEIDLMLLTIVGVMRQFAYYASLDDPSAKEISKKMADDMYQKFDKKSGIILGYGKEQESKDMEKNK